MLCTLKANKLCLLGMLLKELEWVLEVSEDIPSGLKRTVEKKVKLYLTCAMKSTLLSVLPAESQ